MPQLPLDSPLTVAPAPSPVPSTAASNGVSQRRRPASNPGSLPLHTALPSGAVLGLRELCHDLQQEVTLLHHLVDRLVEGRPPAPVERALRAQIGVLHETIREAQGPTAPQVVPLRPIVADVILTAQLVHQGSISLEAPTDACVQGVTSELRRAFVNLLDNARNAAPNGAILVTLRADEDEVSLQVQDDGSGTLDTVGAGIGMAVVGEVARRHGGSVTLAAGALGGLSVTLHLPRLETAA
jgi:signal transduction histidine kinase